MKKLWQKSYTLNPLVEKFTVSTDYLLDNQLIEYDCIGSIAHAEMLKKIGVLTEHESKALKNELLEIIKLFKNDQFAIQQDQEDSHTAIELFLIKQLGTLGEKIHTARSRNDQALLMIRLYMREMLITTSNNLLNLCKASLLFCKKHEFIPIPGRTHFQPAMPSSLGLWAASYVESFLDDIQLLCDSYSIINQCPLGSAAGYGVSLGIDRQLVADLLGFEKVQQNVLYASNSRGKFEAIILHALVQIMTDLSRFAQDLIIFSAPEFDYVSLPKELCTGSSIMPQKHNPDVLELLRAKGTKVEASLFQVLGIIRVLPSGYHRDMQETKAPLLDSSLITEQSIIMATTIINNLKVNAEHCKKAFTQEIFATDRVLSLVKKGIPFRKAYQLVAQNLSEVTIKDDPVENIQQKKHCGATGNLGLDAYEIRIKQIENYLDKLMRKNELTLKNLMNL